MPFWDTEPGTSDFCLFVSRVLVDLSLANCFIYIRFSHLVDVFIQRYLMTYFG